MKNTKFDEVIDVLLNEENAKTKKGDKKNKKKDKVKTLSLVSKPSSNDWIEKVAATVKAINLRSSAYFSKKAEKERNKALKKYEKEAAKIKVY